jgi:hypothetical protein
MIRDLQELILLQKTFSSRENLLGGKNPLSLTKYTLLLEKSTFFVENSIFSTK